MRFADVDCSNRLTLAAAFDYFQEAAVKHAEALGLGIEAMKQTGTAWLLARITMRIERRPRYGEKLTVRTWPRGAEKLFAVRDCAMLDESGAILVLARSNWFIVDLEKHRPLRPQLIMEGIPLNEGIDMTDERTIHLEPREGMAKTGERRAMYSDIDCYGHVNNARYAQWIQDSMDAKPLEQAETLRLDIAYLHEIKLNETIELWRLSPPVSQDGKTSAFAFEGRRNETADDANRNQEPVFRAELYLQGKA